MRERVSIHLASTHRPFDARIFQKECRTLADAGYEVTLIVPHDGDEVVDGVKIRAVPRPRSGKERLLVTLNQIYRAALEEPPNAVYHFHDAELIFHMFALKSSGRCVVYDAHEDTPKQVMYQHWIPYVGRPFVSTVMRIAEWVGARLFDGVIAAEPGIFGRFMAKRRALVHNFPIADELLADPYIPFVRRPMHVAYVGAITRVRGAIEMVEAMHRVPSSLNARLILGGPFFPARLREEVRAMARPDRVEMPGWLSREQIRDVFGRSRVGLVTLHPTPKYVESYPTKLFEYMSAGLPVIASDFPAWRRIVEEAQCGILVDPLDPAAIARAIQWMLEHPHEAEEMGRRGRQAVRERYNWEREANTLLAFYEDLIQDRTPSR